MSLHRPELTVTVTETVRITRQYHFTQGESLERASAMVRQQLHRDLDDMVQADPGSDTPDRYEVLASEIATHEFPEGCLACREAYLEEAQDGRS